MRDIYLYWGMYFFYYWYLLLLTSRETRLRRLSVPKAAQWIKTIIARLNFHNCLTTAWKLFKNRGIQKQLHYFQSKLFLLCYYQRQEKTKHKLQVYEAAYSYAQSKKQNYGIVFLFSLFINSDLFPTIWYHSFLICWALKLERLEIEKTCFKHYIDYWKMSKIQTFYFIY